ncbi:MAG: peptide-binding protein [Thermodesulfovibrionales bacterium]|nr:peptide-binding protein [Thermodesulfovibrionales bacterium]
MNPKTFSEGSSAGPKRLLPMLTGDTTSSGISGMVFSGLVRYTPELTLTGELAQSWEFSPDCRELTFHLRENVKWHDGKDFTSADVVFTYDTVTDPNTPTPYGSIYGPVKDVRATDPYTVKITYKEPFAPAVEAWGLGIVPKHLLSGTNVGESELNRKPIGTGPYRFKQWDTGQKVVLEANQDYFEGTPGIDKYIMRIIPEQSTQLLELRSGGLDHMGLTPSQYKLETEKPQFKNYFNKYRYPVPVFTYMGYNLKDPRFADVRIRRAMTHAINKEELIKGVLLGLGKPANGPFHPDSWAYNPAVKDFNYDPEKALALFAEAGWLPGPDGLLAKDGKPFSFTVITNQTNEQRLKTAQIISERLKAIGVQMKIETREWQAFLHKHVHTRQFEAIIIGWRLGFDPDLYDIWHSSKTGEREFNFVSYANDEVDRLLIEGRQSCDQEKRKAIYNRIHELITEDQPYTFLYVPDATPILHKRFKGVKESPIGILYDFINWQVPEDKAMWY